MGCNRASTDTVGIRGSLRRRGIENISKTAARECQPKAAEEGETSLTKVEMS